VKRRFKDTETTAEVFRGESKNPLYVTTAGIDDEIAREFIQTMHGKHRIPTLLKRVDSECRAI
jgi:deoxyribonuclease V